jgi:hypothetical protein
MPAKQITSATLSQATVKRLDRQRAVISALHDRKYSRSELIEAALEDFAPGEFGQWLVDTGTKLEDFPLARDLADDYATKQDGPLSNSLGPWLLYLTVNKGGSDAFDAMREAHSLFQPLAYFYTARSRQL